MVRRSIGGMALFAVAMLPVAAGAQGRMTVGTFLAKAAALKQKGMMAMLSPDIGLLKSEMQIATTEMKADADARKAAGKPPLACLPQDKSARKMGSDEFVRALEAIPQAQRGMSLKEGFQRVLATKYPCH